MNKKFGTVHYCANFLDKVLSSSASSPADSVHAIAIAISLLKKLDALQEQNPLVTLSFATDSLRVYYRGQLQFHIQARKHRTIIWIPGSYQGDLSHEIGKRPDLFRIEGEHISWVISERGTEWLLDYLRGNWEFSSDKTANAPASHSRHISGEVRQAVLTEFLSSGRWCHGVSGVAKKHKVDEFMQVEFDHILPHSMGGSNGYSNVQVLCADCNRIKRATAA